MNETRSRKRPLLFPCTTTLRLRGVRDTPCEGPPGTGLARQGSLASSADATKDVLATLPPRRCASASESRDPRVSAKKDGSQAAR